ncbi:MAG: CPBP family intramembrane metalloprotease [Bacteroidia bacterium]|nr:CPBP family intramembrane metalloprotease [Bacteroidia bacterium]
MKNTIGFILRGRENRIRNGWWVLIFFFTLSALLFPLILLAQHYGFELNIWMQSGIIALATLLVQALRRKPPLEICGRINRNWWSELFTGSLLGAVLMLVPALILWISGSLSWQMNRFTGVDFLQGLGVMMGVALAEELLFRGFVFQRLLAAFGEWPAQLMMAILFLLTHLDNEGMTGVAGMLAAVNIFMASVLFGRAYLKSKNLSMPLGLHFMANVTQGPVLGFGVSGDQEPGLFRPVLSEASAWLNGGNFGLEASPVALIILLLMTCSPYFRKSETIIKK